MALILSGCMEALKTAPPAGIKPSPSLPGMLKSPVHNGDHPRNTPADAVSPPTPTLVSQSPASPTQQPPVPSRLPTIPPTASSIPTIPPTVSPTPTITPVPPTPTIAIAIVPPTLPSLSNLERWRAQQKQRVAFDAPRLYTTSGSQLWWYDPVYQQHVILGSFTGDFMAQAQFILVGKDSMALEVPYHVNESYGLTALSSALVHRIKEAGYGDWIETYVIVGTGVEPHQ